MPEAAHGAVPRVQSGHPREAHGPLPERCAACRVPAEPRPHHRPAEAKCVACGRSFALKPVGPISKVCQECKPKVNQRSRCMECLLEGSPSGDVLEDGLCGWHLREVWEIERACGRTPDPTDDGLVVNSGAWEWPELGALVDRQLASPRSGLRLRGREPLARGRVAGGAGTAPSDAEDGAHRPSGPGRGERCLRPELGGLRVPVNDRILFMGVQEDPEIAVHLGRGELRVYDGTREPTAGELALVRESLATKAPPTGKRGALYLSGGWTCICGGCLFEETCPAEGPRERHHVRLW